MTETVWIVIVSYCIGSCQRKVCCFTDFQISRPPLQHHYSSALSSYQSQFLADPSSATSHAHKQASKHTHLWQNTDVNTHSWYAPGHWPFSAFLTLQCSGLINWTAVEVLLMPKQPGKHEQSEVQCPRVARQKINFPG